MKRAMEMRACNSLMFIEVMEGPSWAWRHLSQTHKLEDTTQETLNPTRFFGSMRKQLRWR